MGSPNKKPLCVVPLAGNQQADGFPADCTWHKQSGLLSAPSLLFARLPAKVGNAIAGRVSTPLTGEDYFTTPLASKPSPASATSQNHVADHHSADDDDDRVGQALG